MVKKHFEREKTFLACLPAPGMILFGRNTKEIQRKYRGNTKEIQRKYEGNAKGIQSQYIAKHRENKAIRRAKRAGKKSGYFMPKKQQNTRKMKQSGARSAPENSWGIGAQKGAKH